MRTGLGVGICFAFFDLSVADNVKLYDLLQQMYFVRIESIASVLSWLIHVDTAYHEVNKSSLLAACQWCAEYKHSWRKLMQNADRIVTLHGGAVLSWFRGSFLERPFVDRILICKAYLPKEKHDKDTCIMIAQSLTQAGVLQKTSQTGTLLGQYRQYRKRMISQNLLKPRQSIIRREAAPTLNLIRHVELQMLAPESSCCLARRRAQAIQDAVTALPQSKAQEAEEMTVIITDTAIRAEHGVVWDLSRADKFEITENGVRGFSFCWLDMFRGAGIAPQCFTASGMHSMLQKEVECW